MKTEYFCTYDYGQGDLSMWFLADSADAIRAKYPELVVYDSVPDWARERRARSKLVYDLDGPLDEVLLALVKSRDKRTQ